MPLSDFKERFVVDAPHPGWEKRRRRQHVARDQFDRAGLPFTPQRDTIIIKGDAALQLLAARYFKGDVDFARDAIYIKGDTSLIAERVRYFKGDVQFVVFNIYIKGDAALITNPPLNDLGENPEATRPGAISRYWLQLKAVTKDVT